MMKLTKISYAAALLAAFTFTSALSALAHEDGSFKGEYRVGDDDRKITAKPEADSALVEVRFAGEKKPRVYSAEGTEKETEYLEVDKEGKVKTKFIFGNTAATGVFVNEKGQKEKVTRAK